MEWTNIDYELDKGVSALISSPTTDEISLATWGGKVARLRLSADGSEESWDLGSSALSLAYSDDGNLLFAAGPALGVVALASGQKPAPIMPPAEPGPQCVAVAGSWLAVTAGATVTFILFTGREKRQIRLPAPAVAVVTVGGRFFFATHSRYLVSIDADTLAADSPRIAVRESALRHATSVLAGCPGGVALGSLDGRIAVYEPQGNAQVCVRAHRERSVPVAEAPAELVPAEADRSELTTLVWPVVALAWASAGGEYLVSGGCDGGVCLWTQMRDNSGRLNLGGWPLAPPVRPAVTHIACTPSGFIIVARGDAWEAGRPTGAAAPSLSIGDLRQFASVCS